MEKLPEDLIMAQTGHKKRDTLDKYIRRTNKWNPDPKDTVHCGNQSWQEMLAAPMAVIVDRAVEPKRVVDVGNFPCGPAPSRGLLVGSRRSHQTSFQVVEGWPTNRPRTLTMRTWRAMHGVIGIDYGA